jgi:DNA-binding HxlR family transcriptional regulator
MSSSVLRTRLVELVEEGLLAQDEAGYRLTPIGAELGEAIEPLNAWAKRWRRQR